MKKDILDQLKDVKLDFSTYARLPVRDDILIINDPKEGALLKQWEKLNYLRKHLKILDEYISNNKGQTLAQWLSGWKRGLSKIVLDKIGSHNNDTGGISVYFLNLQTFYDEQEAVYDALEARAAVPADLKEPVGAMRDARAEKRKNRAVIRKAQQKDLKADNKGYLLFTVEEEPTPASEAAQEEKKEDDKKPPAAMPAPEEKIKKAGKVGVWIAGVIITVTAITAIGCALTKKE